jgi:hypothetical protein
MEQARATWGEGASGSRLPTCKCLGHGVIPNEGKCLRFQTRRHTNDLPQFFQLWPPRTFLVRPRTNETGLNLVCPISICVKPACSIMGTSSRRSCCIIRPKSKVIRFRRTSWGGEAKSTTNNCPPASKCGKSRLSLCVSPLRACERS